MNFNFEKQKLKKLNRIGALLLMAQNWIGASAQESTPNDLPHFPAQVSVVYPMSTHGQNSKDYTYNFSFNIFSGKVGGINGLEFGSLYNRVLHDVKGIQVGGLVNNTGNVIGIQFAGLGNKSNKMQGIQIAGLGNLSSNATGLQLSGLGNITGPMKGIQIGGLSNISETASGIQLSGLANLTGDVLGLQLAGIANFSSQVRGLQFGGLSNISDDVKGAQISGIINIADNVSGFQFGGIANVSATSNIQISGVFNVTDTISGFQFAGVSNINRKIDGASFGGVFNRTGTLRGFQFGVVNVIDTIEKGVSLAIVNIVKNNFYDEWELSFSDYVNVKLSYKMGIRRFYTIYSIGANFIEDNLWVAGVGFGNRTAISHRIDFQPELMWYSYYPEDFQNVQFTSSTHLGLGFIFNISDKVGISISPSVYFMNADLKDGNTEKVSSVNPFHSFISSETLNSIGMGLKVGIHLQ